MAPPDLYLLAGSASSLVVAAAYGYAAAVIHRRTVPANLSFAKNVFVAWWVGILLVEVVHTAGRTALLAFGIDHLGWHVAMTLVASVALIFALWALVSHLLFTWSGRSWVFPAAGLFYAAYGTAFVSTIIGLQPTGIEAAGWHARLTYGVALSSASRAGIAIGYLAPPILAALAYLRLRKKLPPGAARTRIGRVGLAILLWVGSLILDFSISPGAPLWLVVSAPALGLAAAVMVIVAFRQERGAAPPESSPVDA